MKALAKFLKKHGKKIEDFGEDVKGKLRRANDASGNVLKGAAQGAAAGLAVGAGTSAIAHAVADKKKKKKKKPKYLDD